VADALELDEYEAGDAIYRQGDIGDRFYLIREGTVVISRGPAAAPQLLDRLTEKAYFGERALVKADARSSPPHCTPPHPTPLHSNMSAAGMSTLAEML
jgi:CRP-like cAMP-binding protein